MTLDQGVDESLVFTVVVVLFDDALLLKSKQTYVNIVQLGYPAAAREC